MYKCHLCDLETKQLNSLMTKHWKSHCSDSYPKEQYKIDVLSANGRKQPLCKVCNKPTIIPKGERDYPIYCKICYIQKLSAQTGNDNNNWIGGKQEVCCALCGQKRQSYSTQLEGKKAFCSISCSTKFYCKEENMTEEKRKFFIQGRSKKEEDCFQLIKSLYADAECSYTLRFYNFDIFIPSINLLVEFDGTYWHSKTKTMLKDKRKNVFIAHNYPMLSLLRIPEKEWDEAEDKLSYLNDKINAY